MGTFIEHLKFYLKRRENHVLLFLFVLNLIFKTFHVIIIYKNTGTTKWADDWEYLSMGRQIADGNWVPMLDEFHQMQVGPVLPLLIALFIKIFGTPNAPIFIYNIIITSLIVPLLLFLGKDIHNRKVGWLLAIWSIFYIDFYKYNPHLLKEPTVFFFFPLTLFLLIKAIRSKNNLIYIIFSALSYAWLIHTDERYLLYFPIFPLIFCLSKPFRMQLAIRSIAIWAGIVFIIMLPWGIHNYKVFDQVVIISSRTTAFTSKFWGEDKANMPFTRNNVIPKERNKDALEFGKKYGIAPREYGKNEARARSFINFWQPTYFKPTFIQDGFRFQKWSIVHNISGIIFYGIFLPFFLIGIILLICNKDPLGLFLALIPIIHSLIHSYMIWPLERYRSPVVFIIVMIGFWTVTELYGIIDRIIKRS